jgi:hypothetical protein
MEQELLEMRNQLDLMSSKLKELNEKFIQWEKYKNGKIYKIVGGGLTYYGSTCKKLNERLNGHKRNYTQYLNGKKKWFTTSFKIFALDDYKIELVENYPCRSKEELLAREGYYVANFECINKAIPNNYNSVGEVKYQKQYRENHQKEIIDYRKQYYNDNAEMLREKSNNFYINNKDKVNERKRQHYETNKEKILEKCHEYYENNKEKVFERQNKEVLCVCGITHSVGHTFMHRQTQKHQDFINGIQREAPPKRTDRITCECGAIYTHSNKSSHMKTTKHQTYIKNK